MKLQRQVYVVGGAHSTFIGKMHPDFVWKKHPDFGLRENPTLEEHMAVAVRSALDVTGVEAEAVQRGFVGNFAGELFASQGHLGAMLARLDPAFEYKPMTRVEAACASGGLAVASAVDAIQAGYDLVLVVGAEVQTTVNARIGADFLARAAHYESERSIDEFTFPCLFARRARAYKEAWGVTDAQIAAVVVKAYTQAALNPFAHMRTVPMSLENASTASDANPLFLGNPDFRDHLKVSDCSQVSDGASALLLASAAGLARLGKTMADVVEVAAVGHSTAALGRVRDLTLLDNTMRATAAAYEDAGITPSDVEIAEVHDCFSVTEVLMIEALGLAEPGAGWKLAVSGDSGFEGRLPVNTGGGLLAFGHPVGATGVKQLVELHRQMKGLAGDYQVPRVPALGVAANMGGDDRTAVVTVLRNT